MKLTGKAKDEFEFWLRGYYKLNRKDYDKYPFPIILKKFYRKTFTEQYGLIIEWLDSVGILIAVQWFDKDWIFAVEKMPFKQNHYRDFGFKTRQEATEKAIEKANEIYNNLDK